mgnify:CR=1 FL=1
MTYSPTVEAGRGEVSRRFALAGQRGGEPVETFDNLTTRRGPVTQRSG